MLMLQEQNGGNCTIYFLMSLLRMRLSVQLHDFHKSCIYHLCHMRYNGKIGRNHGFGGAYAKRISNLPASTSHVSFEWFNMFSLCLTSPSRPQRFEWWCLISFYPCALVFRTFSSYPCHFMGYSLWLERYQAIVLSKIMFIACFVIMQLHWFPQGTLLLLFHYYIRWKTPQVFYIVLNIKRSTQDVRHLCMPSPIQ